MDSRVHSGIFSKNGPRWILALLCLGVVLRILKAYWITGPDQDEGFVYNEVFRHPLSDMMTLRNFYYRGHPPLGYIFLKIWSFVSDSEYTYRIPNLCVSVLSVFTFHRLAKFLLPRFETARFAALFFFVTSPFFIYYGVIYRNYSLAIFLSLFALLQGFQIDQKEAGQVRVGAMSYVLYALTVCASLWTDYSSYWALTTFGMWQLYRGNIRRPSVVILGVCGVLMFAIGVHSVLPGFGFILSTKVDSLPPMTSAWDFFFTVSYFFELRFLLSLHPAFAYLVCLVIFGALAGLRVFKKNDPGMFPFFLIGIVLPNFIMVTFSLLVSPVFDYKHLWFSNLLLAISFLVFVANGTSRKLLLSVIALLIIGMLPLNITGYRNEIVFQDSTRARTAMEMMVKRLPTAKFVLAYRDNGDWAEIVGPYRNWYFSDRDIELVPLRKEEPIKFTSDRETFYFDLSGSTGPVPCSGETLEDQSFILSHCRRNL